MMRQRFAARFPTLGRPEITNSWAGMIDAMPDVVPVVDRIQSIDGLIVATGMSGHGFGIGPGFGKAIAHIAADRATGHDLSRFRFSRFSDGSRLVPGPSL
jgi:glycine/D-amino acid oxidase-like deaminating enzyme